MRASWIALATFAAVATLGCYVPPERLILEQFFVDSRLRDRTALAAFSTVVFEPLEQGIVTDFTIVDRSVLSRNSAGDVSVKAVTITAPVKLPSGEVKEKRIVLRMEQQPPGWKITAISEQ